MRVRPRLSLSNPSIVQGGGKRRGDPSLSAAFQLGLKGGGPSSSTRPGTPEAAERNRAALQPARESSNRDVAQIAAAMELLQHGYECLAGCDILTIASGQMIGWREGRRGMAARGGIKVHKMKRAADVSKAWTLLAALAALHVLVGALALLVIR
jgi:hypothetical protein